MTGCHAPVANAPLSVIATWRADEAVSQIFAELWQYADNVHTELLDPETGSAEAFSSADLCAHPAATTLCRGIHCEKEMAR